MMRMKKQLVQKRFVILGNQECKIGHRQVWKNDDQIIDGNVERELDKSTDENIEIIENDENKPVVITDIKNDDPIEREERNSKDQLVHDLYQEQVHEVTGVCKSK